ncbi:ABC transporter ATP-binding protein [Frondihabitans sp. PAMC 28766]|uniref:ABC transporter ATP-binding protein n=1 Tax=Frondihabitans sp. PAMC 28766 TaxID=1795630 RepID=UPI0009ECB90A|nr:ATP-binding cassette domain-containing protein [Frondihabitans sp. PAMC 28766]
MTAAPEAAITVRRLTKTYGAHAAVDDVSFTARPGAVTALLGPNGSGKSTTMRLMLGLARADSGEVLFGSSTYDELVNPAADVGILLDASAQHTGRSVRESVELAGLMCGASRQRVRQCLATVGLADVSSRKVGALSLGMRQRLGLAIALLGAPKILLLDEPGNGLDPEGLAWLNEFLSRFARAGGTVLVSSHHLAEIEAIADDLVVLDRGQAKYAGPARDFGGANDTRGCRASSVNDEALLAAAAERGIPVEAAAGGGVVADVEPEVLGRLSVETGVALTSLARIAPSLQQYFLDTTSGEFQGRHDDLMALSKAPEVP